MASAGAAAKIVREIAAVGAADLAAAAEPLRADCLRLARKVSLLSHLVAEVAEAGEGDAAAAAWVRELVRALEAARRFVELGRAPPLPPTVAGASDQDAICDNAAVQFKYVTWQLQAALTNLPHSCFQISDEVQEEVDLVRAQLRRDMEKKGALDVNIFSKVHDILARVDNAESQSQPHGQPEPSQMQNHSKEHLELKDIVLLVSEISGLSKSDMTKVTSELVEGLRDIKSLDSPKPVNVDNQASDETKSLSKVKKPDSVAIPEDFRCPVSLELMRDPVIVSTGQTYERAFIQRWIDCGNRTCPKTQQKLHNLTLTPNYVLRSLIMQWCEEKGIEPPSRSKNDGSSLEIGGDRLAVEALVRNLSSSSLDERKSAAAEIRSLAKKSTDNRILLAESSAIPALVKLLSSKDLKTQEHAVTALLNLSIYDQNKELIVVAGAIVPIIQVLRMGSMEARENAAAAIFSLSLIDDNKIMIGSTPGAIEALVELLQTGSSRGRKDAATALFNLCIYQANKVRAVRAGILAPLIRMLQDSSRTGAIDEALTILSVLVSHRECKTAISKGHAIPFLIDLLRSGQARNKENAAAILLALCKKDAENLACIGRLGAQIPLTELAKTGTDRAKRKATSLLEHLSKLQVL
ncbi:U-box domain-containing protein 11-like [Phragmites australis]|uniref:U-box domain-containing protein 11-like n=1 Tax=Phragmites australis TaxID=29695 RepID=UPI002D798AD8|nr:U-box domain-containing protein 11-like [Phragmites australis]